MTLQFTVRVRNFLFDLNKFVMAAFFEALLRVIRIVILKLFATHKIIFDYVL